MPVGKGADDDAAKLRAYRDVLKRKGNLLGARAVDRCIHLIRQPQESSAGQLPVKQPLAEQAKAAGAHELSDRLP